MTIPSTSEIERATRFTRPEFKTTTFAELAEREVPPREWIVKDWIPANTVTSLYGIGGEGKTFLSLEIAECVSAGKPFMGYDVSQGEALLMLNEDDTDEVGRRVQRLSAGSPNAHVIDFSTVDDPCLMRFDRDGSHWTWTGVELEFLLAYMSPKLVVLDPIGMIFGGNENDRAEVGAFIRKLNQLASFHRCAFLLIGHPSKDSNSQYSGSTGWSNSIRSRLELKKVKDTKDEYRLFRHKANYGEKDEEGLHLVKTEGGVFKSAALFDLKGQRKRAEADRRDDCDRLAKDFLQYQHKRGGSLPTTSSGSNSLYQMIAAVWPEQDHPFTNQELAASMIRLTEDGFLVQEQYKDQWGKNRVRYVLSEVPKP